MIEEALIPFLRSNADVSGMVGNRIHHNARPQDGALPVIVIHRVSGPRERVLVGRVPLAHPRIQLDCMGGTAKDAQTLADKVRKAVEDFHGTMGEYTVQVITVDDDRDDYIDPEHANENGIHVTSLDAIIWYEETLA